MSGWNLSFETNMWYFLPHNDHWSIRKSEILKDILGFSEEISCSIQDKKKKKSASFYHNAGLKETQEKYFQLFVKEKYIRKYETLFNKLKRDVNKLVVKYIKGENPGLMKSAEVAAFGGAIHYLTQPHRLELIEKEIQRIQEKHNISQDALLSLLEHEELISPQKQRIAWLKLIIDFHRKELKKDNLKIFQRLFCSSFVIARTVSDKKDMIIPISELVDKLKEDAKTISVANARRELKETIEKNQKLKNKRNNIKRKYQLNKEETYILDMYAKLTYYRLEGRNLWIIPYVYVTYEKKRVAKELGLHEDDFDGCTLEQFALTVEKKIITKVGIQPKFQLKLTEKGRTSIYYDNAARKKVEQLQIPFDIQAPDKVKGEVTFENGVIKGKARVIKWAKGFEKEMNKMQKDEILIVDQTKPDLMPAIRKAKGIVTNEGGFISHAAIISRELKIPCIIQTKYATRAFETGDNIIMNTKTGEVKKDDN